MKKYLFICILFIHTLWAGEDEKETYLQYLKQYEVLGPFGNAAQGEIEIILDKAKMEEIEKAMGRKVGIVAQDKYWLWINDAVYFPSGKSGVYGRVMWRQSLQGITGAAVMPVLPDGRIVLNRNYRHATRSWEYELPRGGANPGESAESVAIREAKEETGMVIDELYLLGEMAVDTGILNAISPVFMAKVIEIQEAEPEDAEAIAAVEAFSVDELKQGFMKGYLTVESNGAALEIPLRDPFLAFALFQAELRHLLK
ncbi:MAG TPA: NUDIX hydrolase [Rhabdochlamydiaceae bacterium]|nr:NUDIX hydrolase [Rhabdochlamydiaceae bacterium]